MIHLCKNILNYKTLIESLLNDTKANLKIEQKKFILKSLISSSKDKINQQMALILKIIIHESPRNSIKF